MTTLVHTAFYRFVQLASPDGVAAHLRQLLAQFDGLTGSILLATEGINGMLAASPDAVDGIEHALQHDPAFAGAFTGMVFKRSTCNTPPFARLKVHVKKEIVPLGIEGVDARRTGDCQTVGEIGRRRATVATAFLNHVVFFEGDAS